MLEARPEGWWARWCFTGTVDFIKGNGFTRAALQFPDELLADSITVASDLQESLNALGHKAEVTSVVHYCAVNKTKSTLYCDVSERTV